MDEEIIEGMRGKKILTHITFWAYFQIWVPYSFNNDYYYIAVTRFPKVLLNNYTH